MKKLILLCCTLSLLACRHDKPGIKIGGTIKNADGRTLYLELLDSPKPEVLDSVRLDAEGAFEFRKPVKGLEYLRLRMSDSEVIQLIADSSDAISIEADARDLSRFRISGSPNSELLKSFNDSLQKSFAEGEAINKIYHDAETKGGLNMDSVQQSLQKSYDQVLINRAALAKRFISSHPSSIVTLSAMQFLDINRDMHYYMLIDSALVKAYPSSKYVRDYHSRMSLLAKRNPVGSLAPDITATSPSGKNITLSSLRGKIVLLDFWASWCKPCRAGMPELVKVYAKFKNKGFEIYSLSLDSDKQAWENAIRQDKITWVQVSDGKEWKSPFVGKYYVEAIPYMCLLDKEGKIIAKGITAKELEEKLTELLPGRAI